MHTFPTEVQSTDERVDYAFDATNRKPSGGSVSSATATFTPSGGSRTALNTSVTVSGSTVTATVIGGTDFTATSTTSLPHYLDVLIIMSNSEKVRGRVPVLSPV